VSALRLIGIHKRALAGFDLEVASGELIVLAGPSGSGKSTALRIIAGVDEPSAGRVFLGGRDVTGAAPAQRDVALVSQGAALYPHLSVFENLAFALRVRQVPAAELGRRVDAAVSALGIGDLLARFPRQLSTSERQRVAIARAIARQPRVFLYDEPLAPLDAVLRAETRRAILRTHQELGATTIVATHDPVDATALAGRVVSLPVLRVSRDAARDPLAS